MFPKLPGGALMSPKLPRGGGGGGGDGDAALSPTGTGGGGGGAALSPTSTVRPSFSLIAEVNFSVTALLGVSSTGFVKTSASALDFR